MTLAPLSSVPSVFMLAADKIRPAPVTGKRLSWLTTARKTQLPPPGTDWDVWFMLAGRGFGKTRTGAEHVVQFCRDNPGAEVAVIGRTDAEARRILLRGPSGLLSVLEPGELHPSFGAGKGYVDSPGDTRMVFANGATVYIVGANSPDALRGLNLWMAWCDELASWRYQQVLWDEVLDPAVRIGPHPHILVTTTPRPTKLIRSLLREDTTRVVRGSTFDNARNLADKFLRRMKRKYDVDEFGRARTRAGRQELNAEVLDDVPGALTTQSVLDASRREWTWDDDLGRLDPPRGIKIDGLYREAVMALDPSDGNEDGDEQAWSLVGLGWDNDLYVEETGGMRVGPTEFLGMAVDKAQANGATIVVEKNHGGRYLVATLEQVMKEKGVIVPVRVVVASDGKRTRAEPIVPLFERDKLHLVGSHMGEGEDEGVEEQLTSWLGKPGEKSPDRLDALVWGVSHFLRHSLGSTADDDDAGAYAYDDGRDDWASDYDTGSYTYG